MKKARTFPLGADGLEGEADSKQRMLVSLIFIYAAKSRQSCLTLYDPIDGSPPGSAVPGILQARILEWVAISFSKVNVS